MLLATVVLLALLLSLGATLVRRTALPACALIVLSAVWLPANSKLEGPILFVLSYAHGVTLADLLAVAGAVIGAVVLIQLTWRRSARADRAWNVATVVGASWSVLVLGALVALNNT